MPEFLATLPRPLNLLGGGLRRNLPVFAELAGRDPGDGAKFHHPLHHADRLICHSAGHFMREYPLPARPACNLQYEVCKGSANVNTDPDHRCPPDTARQKCQTWRPIDATSQGPFCPLA
jgi:hypothetical protein